MPKISASFGSSRPAGSGLGALRRLPRRRAGVRVRRRGIQLAAVHRHDQGHHQAAEPSDRKRRLPAPQRGQEHHGGRRHGPAEVSGEGVQRERAPEPPMLDPGRQDGVVGRVEHAVADAHEDHQDEQRPIAGREAGGGDRRAHDPQADHERPSGPEAIDQETDRRLEHHGDQARHGEQEAEGGVTDRQLLAQERKQRRQHDHVEMGEEVPGGDERQDLGVAPRRRAGHGEFSRHGTASRYGTASRSCRRRLA